MLRAGLVSVTFRKLTPGEVVALTRQAGLSGIEWNGDTHVLPGDVAQAREVRELTIEAGLSVSAYGSYYRVGQSEATGLTFSQVLETAVELGAPTVRVWAGTAASAATPPDVRAKIVSELRRLAEVAGRSRLSLSLEFHSGTLTDTNESACDLLEEVNHSNVFTFWQPHNGVDTASCLKGLRDLLPRISNVHVFHWWPTDQDRHPLAEGKERWKTFLEALALAPGDHEISLEFVPQDSPASFLRDAATLKTWLSELPSPVAAGAV